MSGFHKCGVPLLNDNVRVFGDLQDSEVSWDSATIKDFLINGISGTLLLFAYDFLH
jgi:hypothetical protein